MHQLFQEVSLSCGKLVVYLRIAVDLDGHILFLEVVEGRDHLGKAALTKHFQHLESIQDMGSLLHDVVALFIVPA